MIKGNKRYRFLLNLLMLLLSLSCVFPFVLLLSSSFSSEKALIQYGYRIIPKEFSLEAYKYILQKAHVVLRAYAVTIFVTVTGVIANLTITVLISYPLSRKELAHKKALSFYIFFTMLFNGGLVPYYITWTRVFGIKNTLFALLVPNLLMNAFHIMMMKSFFLTSIPESVIEAARIDGAGEFAILNRIVLPLSKPIIATMGLMAGLGFWNDWTNGMYFITDTKLYSIQQLLNQMLMNVQFLSTVAKLGQAGGAGAEMPSVGIRMAIAVLGILPVMAAYPFFQKYFVKGITIGAVKG